jgi:hypothetical protein
MPNMHLNHRGVDFQKTHDCSKKTFFFHFFFFFFFFSYSLIICRCVCFTGANTASRKCNHHSPSSCTSISSSSSVKRTTPNLALAKNGLATNNMASLIPINKARWETIPTTHYQHHRELTLTKPDQTCVRQGNHAPPPSEPTFKATNHSIAS